MIEYNPIDKQDNDIDHQLNDDLFHRFVYLNLIAHYQLMHIQNAVFKFNK